MAEDKMMGIEELANSLLADFVQREKIADADMEIEGPALRRLANAAAIHITALTDALETVKANRINVTSMVATPEAAISRRSVYNHKMLQAFIEFASRRYRDIETSAFSSRKDKNEDELRQELELLYRRDDETEQLKSTIRKLSHELDEKNTIISSIYSRIGYDEDVQNSGYNILDYIKRWKPE